MIIHTVLLQPKPESTPEIMQGVLGQVRALQESIPGIVEVHIGENLNITEKNRGYTYGFAMYFGDEQQLQAYYASHTVHKVVRKVSMEIRRTCENVIDFDLAI